MLSTHRRDGFAPHRAVSTQHIDSRLRILVDLGQDTTVGALKVWNYNADLEGTYAGVRRLLVTLDAV